MSKIRLFIHSITSIFFIICLCCFSSCRDEVFSSDPNDKLSFSVDTLSFDTVFSTITSSTKRIMVRNNNSKALRISQIGLEKDSLSVFKINVDGGVNPDNKFREIEISAKDSMYIFVSVNVDSLSENSPLYIKDHLFFETNGSVQQVVLETYGQNVEILRGKTILNDTTLTAEKPYIIYDSLIVAQGNTLRLEPGTRLYFHNNTDLYVYGNFEAKGTAERPILIRGDRFDNINFGSPVPYNEVAGQWGGIYLVGPSGNHNMEHVTINSGYVGIYLTAGTQSSTPAPNEIPKLKIINCKIHNFLFYGLVAQNANVTVLNSLISNTGSYSVYLNGGKHTFVHTTIANYFNSGVSAAQSKNRDHKEPAVMIMNMNKSATMETEFINCAIAGNIANEFSLATRFPEQYQGTFKNTYIKRDALEYPQFEAKDTIRWYEKNDTIFKSTELNYDNGKYYNFEPDSVSPLRRLADPAILRNFNYSNSIRYDLNGIDREESDKPAAGAYEWRSDYVEE